MHSNGTIESVNRERWYDLACCFLDYNYQQSPAYADALAKRHHADCEYIAIKASGRIIGLTNVRIRTVPMIGGGIAYIAGGPLTRMGRDDDIDRLAHCLSLLHNEYVGARGLILRILAPLGSPQWNSQATNAFRHAGLVPTDRSRSYRTFLLDIARPLDEVRDGCSKYWRRNLRRAYQKSFVIRAGTAIDLFEPICVLYRRLLERKQFHAELDARFYAAVQAEMSDEERFTASIVETDGKPVVGLVASMLGDTCVPLILATDESGLRSYAVYLLQWHSIVMAHDRGMRYYDLGGIDPEGNVGVYNFKKGLRGLDLSAPGPFGATPSGVKGVIARGAEGMYRHLAPAQRVVFAPLDFNLLRPGLFRWSRIIPR